MAIIYSAPHSLSCARLMAMHSCSSLIPSFYKDSITFQQPSKGIKASMLSISYSYSSERINSARSVKTACVRPEELAMVTGDTWEECVVKSDIPVLVEFWAAWCGPCRMVHREIEEIAKEYSGRIKCFTIKADEEMKVAEKYDVKVVPVVVLFRNGKQYDSVTGTMPTYIYTNAIDKLLSI